MTPASLHSPPPRFCDFAMALALPRRAWAHQRCLFPLPRKIAARPLSIGSLTGFGGTAPSEKRGGARLGGIGSSSRLCTTSVQCILCKVYHNTPVFESVPPKKHTPFLQPHFAGNKTIIWSWNFNYNNPPPFRSQRTTLPRGCGGGATADRLGHWTPREVSEGLRSRHPLLGAPGFLEVKIATRWRPS